MENQKLEKLDVLKVYISDKKRDGSPIVDFKGSYAQKVSIKTKQYPDKYLYSYPISRKDDLTLKITDNTSLKVMVWENNGFMNFKLPSRLDLLEVRIKELEDAVFEKETAITGNGVPEFTPEELTGQGDMPNF